MNVFVFVWTVWHNWHC